jgi:hypothetical protein
MTLVGAGDPQLLGKVRQLNIELHFSAGLGMASAEDVDKLVATIRLLNSHGFKMWYSFPNGHSTAIGPHGLTQLYSAGLDEHTCCYEVSFIRANRRPVTRSLVSSRRWRLSPSYTFPDGKLWHNQGVEFVDEDTFRGKAAYTFRPLARLASRLQAADLRASETSCTSSRVSTEAATKLVVTTRSTQLDRRCEWYWLTRDDTETCWTAWAHAVVELVRKGFF